MSATRLVVERRVFRMSTDMTDAIGCRVLGSMQLWLRGGGLLHTLLVEGDNFEGGRCVYWDRNDNRFRTIDVTQQEIDSAEREWATAPEGRQLVLHHNPMCVCTDCATRKAQNGILTAPPHADPDPPKEAPPPPPSAERANIELELAALAERVRVLEHAFAAVMGPLPLVGQTH